MLSSAFGANKRFTCIYTRPIYCTVTVLCEREFHDGKPVQHVLPVPVWPAHAWARLDQLAGSTDLLAVHHNWIESNRNWWARVVLIQRVQKILVV